MASENYKIKLTKTGEKGDTYLPQFSLTYKAVNKNELKVSYEILSMLKDKNDLVIEVNNSLAFGSDSENEKLALNFLNQVQKLNLDYTHSQMMAPARSSLITQLMGKSKNIESHEILAYVSDSVWADEIFKNIIPYYSARYYITKKSEDAKELLNAMAQMSDIEKRKYFKLIVFHAPTAYQMGIISEYLKESDMKGLLGI